MSRECKHPAKHLFCYTINDPKQDKRGNVVYANGSPVYQTLLISLCKKCKEVLPFKVIKEWTVDHQKYQKWEQEAV